MKVVLPTLLVFVTPLLVVNPVLANSQRVHVLVAYDEEFDSIAHSLYWYTPEFFAQILITSVSWRFEELFNIKFMIIRYVSWDSDDGINNIDDLLDECVEETGFYSGMTYNTIPIDILIAFSNQDTGEAYGYCEKEIGAVIVYETYYWLSLGQCTDNALQHELSHLYYCGHHDQAGLDCVMNCFFIKLNDLEGWVPIALTTENWCNNCINTIDLNREIWGREVRGGGGPGGPYPLPESVEEEEGPL